MDVNLYVDSNNGDFTLTADGSVITDKTLTKSGMAADSKATGDAINAEKVAREGADADLQLQINQIITPGGAPSEAEITNARIGADGTVYDNLGDAIREQVTDLDESIAAVSEELLGGELFKLQDMTSTRGTLSKTIDTVNDTITISISSSTTYAGVSLATGSLQYYVIPGRKYRLHAKAEKISGTPYMAAAVRGVSGNSGTTYAMFTLNDGEDKYVDFVATEYNSYITLFISWASSTNGSSVKYSEVWLKEIIGDSAIDIEARNTAKLTNQFVLPRCLVWGRQAYARSSGTYSNSNNQSSTIPLVFKDAVRITSTNENIEIQAKPVSASLPLSGWLNDITIPGNTEFILSYKTKDVTNFKAEYIEDVIFSTTAESYNDFYSRYFYNITEEIRFRSSKASVFFDGYLWTDSNMIGCRTQHDQTYFKSSSKVLVSDKDVTIYVTRYNSTAVKVIVNGSIVETILQGNSYTITAGMEFTLAVSGSNTSTTNDYGWNVIISPDTMASFIDIDFALSWNNLNNITRADCSFIDENGVLYNINRNGEYYIFVNNVLTDTKPLTGTLGHANNCNYIDGKVYISSWSDDKTKIHVYTVNTTSQTLTYAYDITMPIPSDLGATEYFVLDGERQIISFSMTNSNTCMSVSVWTKVGSTYIESKRQALPMQPDQAGWIQGFTYTGGKIYYVMGKDDYKHLGTGVFNLETGLIEKVVVSSVLNSDEIEGIIPLEKDLFLLVSVHGVLFLQHIN